MEKAKKTISTANKVEYIVSGLEDLEEVIDSSMVDNKNLLKSKINQYITDLANATDEVALSAEIKRYLTFFSKFHNYSFYNRMLIYIQNPDATRVASYKKWQETFRQVNKGAISIKILAPIISKSNNNKGDEDALKGLNPTSDVSGFRAVPVFDVSDTTPIDERGNVPEAPQWWGDNTPSETADILYAASVELAKDMGIDVTQVDSKRGEKGFSAGDHINISTGVEGAGRLSTMVHEMAHELMHHKGKSIYYQENTNREVVELQAESVSYVVLKHYGIPVAHHPTYLALWKANKERIQSSLEIISKVSEFIVKKLDEEVSYTQNNKN